MDTKILNDYSEREKSAYLCALASLATADHTADQQELDYLAELVDAAGLQPQQKEAIRNAARGMNGDELKDCLDILRNSDLRFSLVAELISFSKSDGQYNDAEKKHIEEISQQLGMNPRQHSLLDQFTDKTENAQAAPTENKNNFLESLGLKEKFEAAGINFSSLSKGLLAIAAPLLLGKLLGNRTGKTGGKLMSGLGIGSLLSALSMGRGFGNTNNLLSRILNPTKRV